MSLIGELKLVNRITENKNEFLEKNGSLGKLMAQLEAMKKL